MEAEQAARSLGEFIAGAWHVVEHNQFIPNWHIDCIVEHLEAVSNGDIKRLIINIPPRHTKSLIVSVFWPAWVWTQEPWHKWLYSSYDFALSTRDSVKCRRVIQSPWYRERWGNKFKLTSDQNVKTRFENDATGYRIATSIEGAGTGEGGDTLVIDDPHNTAKVLSDVYRNSALSWHDHVWFNRLNDEKTGAKVYIGQRSHHMDLFGHLLEHEGGYELICLPMEYEKKNRIFTSLDWEDKRTLPGEVLNPERFPPASVEEAKKKGTYIYASQYQQNPAPLEGGIINLSWFREYVKLPPKDLWIRIVQGWDTAQKPDELLNDPWVGGTWLESKLSDGSTTYFLLDVVRKWMNYPAGKKEIKLQADKWKPSTIVIEDKSSGSSLIQELPLIPGWKYPILPFEPEGDKLTRLAVESPAIEMGMVWLPKEATLLKDTLREIQISLSWLSDYLLEMGTFPNSEHADMADMTSMMLKFFREGMQTRGGDSLLTVVDDLWGF